MKNEVKDEDELWELYYQKNGGMSKEIVRFFMEKNCHIIHSNSLHIEIIKNKVVYKNLHETYACTCT